MRDESTPGAGALRGISRRAPQAGRRSRPTRSEAQPSEGRQPDRKRSPTASCASRSRTWPTRSSTSRCSAATTSPSTRCAASAAPRGQHACLVADALGMTRVFIHPLAGVLSAYGMGLADVRSLRQQAVESALTEAALASADATFAALETVARAEVAGQGVPPRGSPSGARCTSSTTAPTRRSRLPVAASLPVIAAEFEKRYAQQYGFLMPDKRAHHRGRRRRGDRQHAIGGGRAAAVRATSGAAGGAQGQPCLHRRRVPRRERVRPRRICAPATRSPAPRSSANRTRPPSSSRAGARRSPPATTSSSSAWKRRSARTPSAPPPIRSCSRCSTTCSWRSPSRWA